MSDYQCWFRPWLDDPGPWEVWRLDREEEAAVASILESAGQAACERLTDLYGAQADRFGAVALARQSSSEAASAEDLFRMALAILSVDYYRARVGVPRSEPGGSTNPANQQRWSPLRPYLMQRLKLCLAANATDSLLARAVLGRIADNWIPGDQISRRLEQAIMASGDFTSVEVALDLRPPAPGGRVWLRAETEKAVAAATALLAERQPALVEVLRDPMAAPATAQFVVVYHLEETADGWIRLICYDPEDASNPCRIRLKLIEGDVLFEETPAGEARPVAKGLRLMDLPPALPPLSWPRRWFRWVFGLLWYLKRRWLIFRHRKRDRDLSKDKEADQQPS